MKRNYLLLAFIASIFFPSGLLAWGMTGHRVIAEIAQLNIKSKTESNVSLLLDGLPMAYWANWPDFIKSDKTGEWDHTHIWHYVNAPANLSKKDFVAYIKDIEQANIYSEVPKLVRTLRDKVSSVEEKRVALIFLIHLMGDLHQPMHVGREDDLGGNRVSVFWFKDQSNLHAVWDTKLIDYEKYSYTEYANILNTQPKEERIALKRGSLEDWLYESHILANEIYGSVDNGDKLMYEYSYKYKTTVESQLLKAGLRLAAVLDMIFR